MGWKINLSIGLVTLLGTSSYNYFADVGRALSTFSKNTPDKLANITTFASHEIKFADRIRNCEDAVLDDSSGFAILSCNPGLDLWNPVMGIYIDQSTVGSLYLYRYEGGLSSDGESDDGLSEIKLVNFSIDPRYGFHPLGINYHAASRTLFVVNLSSPRPTIEVFILDPGPATATHQRTFAHPLLVTPNAIAVASATEIYVSNTHSLTSSSSNLFVRRALAYAVKAELLLGLPTGSVVHVDLTTGATTRVLSLAFANGVALLDGGTTLAVASSNKMAVYLYHRESTAAEMRFVKRVKLPFFVDNLRVDGRGKLLMAGHPHNPSFEAVVHTNYLYHGTDGKCDENERLRAPSWVSEWDGDSGLKDLFTGMEYGCSSTALRDAKRGLVFVVGLYEHGILVGRE